MQYLVGIFILIVVYGGLIIFNEDVLNIVLRLLGSVTLGYLIAQFSIWICRIYRLRKYKNKIRKDEGVVKII